MAGKTHKPDSGADTAQRSTTWGRLIRDPQTLIVGSLFLFGLFIAFSSAWLMPHDPNVADLNVSRGAIGEYEGYPLGTDASGRDTLSRLMASTTTAFVAGAIGAGVATIVGVVFGLIGGYFGPRIRASTEALFSLVMTFPGILLLVVLMPVTGGDYRPTMLIFGVLLSPSVYRIVKNLVVGTRNELYVDAARAAGLSTPRILSKHILFVIRGPIVIAAAFIFGGSVGVQSGLAFLGVGSNQVPSFGLMMSTAFSDLSRSPVNFVLPAVSLGLLTASFVLLGNSLRDAFGGPKQKPVKKVRHRKLDPGAMQSEKSTALLAVKNLSIAYPLPGGGLREVLKDVSFELSSGEILGLVGESGSGKSQTAFAVLGVLPPEAQITGGSIQLEGKELVGLAERELQPLRGKQIAYIPQDPMSNLDPSFTIGYQLIEGLRANQSMSKTSARAEVLTLLGRVGIADPSRTFGSYPHEVSGGMAQRVLIAGAIAARPKLLIADEPTTALDVTVQAEILDLLRELQQEIGMAVLLVTHNFGVVADLCDRIAVMQEGVIVETGSVHEIFDKPQHPYTRNLLEAILDESGPTRQDGPSVTGGAQ